jgi:hypothetical protein
MSLCRKSEGDVYIFSHVDDTIGSYRCFACELSFPFQEITLTTKQKLVSHIKEHEEAKHKLPKDIWKRVKKIKKF